LYFYRRFKSQRRALFSLEPIAAHKRGREWAGLPHHFGRGARPRGGKGLLAGTAWQTCRERGDEEVRMERKPCG